MLDAACMQGWTPLHYAVANQNFTMARKLLEQGASVAAECHRVSRHLVLPLFGRICRTMARLFALAGMQPC